MCLSGVVFDCLKFMDKPDSFYFEVSEIISFYTKRLVNGSNLLNRYKSLVSDLGSLGVSLKSPSDLEVMIGCLSFDEDPFSSIAGYILGNLGNSYLSCKVKSLLV